MHGMSERVRYAFQRGKRSDQLAEDDGIVITRNKFRCLIPGNWLNSEVINFLMLRILVFTALKPPIKIHLKRIFILSRRNIRKSFSNARS